MSSLILAIRRRMSTINRAQLLNHAKVGAVVLLGVFVFVTTFAPSAPVSAASFSINADSLLDNAAIMFNAVMPVLSLSIGLTLGIGLAKFLAGTFRNLFG